MSLLTGMNDMLTNKAALEAAHEMFDFDEDFALEADELIDTMVDGIADASTLDDDIDVMEEELEEDDEINDELESEDNFTDTVGKSANESAALTGTSFLASLSLDKNDPITTKDGSVGSEDSTATHKDNFSAEANDNNDPITTKDGSVGADSNANPTNNFTDTSKDNNDPITTKDGSVGQKNSTAKDPAVESALFYGELLGEEDAMEGFIQKIKDKHSEKKTNKRLSQLQLVGLSSDLDINKVWDLVNNCKHDQAKKMVNDFGKKLESIKSKISSDDPDASTKTKTIDRLIKTNSSLLLKVEKECRKCENKKKGMDDKAANEAAMSSLRKTVSGIEDVTMEAYLTDCLNMMEAFESEVDPEATTDGSVGQDNSKASFDGNFSDGKLDSNDPIKTKDGSEGQEDSKATFDENFSDGKDDTDDPIKTEDGSVGQKDSTAKDPVVESSLTDELENLNSIMFDDFDDDDDDLV